MILRQYYLDCLSQASYLIGDESTGRAVVVDPRRDVSEYLADCERWGLQVEAVIETHIHADFVSGHLELAAQTGASICYGAGAVAEFAIRELADGERLSLGEVELEIIATPGHTPESICVVVYEHPGAPAHAVLTGDTLFIGDVGRPDLCVGEDITVAARALSLFQSLHGKLLTLPDAALVYPAHGAGSSCGKNLSSETVSTLGEQRQANAALQPMPEQDFVELVSIGQPVLPQYFGYASQRNRERHQLFTAELPLPDLTLEGARTLVAAGGVVLDVRPPEEFCAGHLRGSLNVGMDGRFAEFCGSVLEPAETVVLTGIDERAAEARLRLARIGFDRVAGRLRDVDAVLDHNPGEFQRGRRVAAADVDSLIAGGEVQLVDVRTSAEREEGGVPGARGIPLVQLRSRMQELDPARPVLLYCAGGYRSSMAASLLRRHAFSDVSDIEGGYAAWKAASAVTAPR